MFTKSNSKNPEIFQSNMKLERRPSLSKVQVEIKINLSFQLNEVKRTFPYSRSISFRLNPPSAPATEGTEDQHFTSQLYFNPVLVEKINRFKPKLHVDLSYSHLIDADMNIVADQVIREKKCTELWLYGNQISHRGAEILAASLRENSTLKSLDLSYNRISDLGVRTLSEALSPNQNCSLKTLHLSKNRISNEGAKYLSEMLRTNQTITELWLSDNEIGSEGVRQLANVLAYHNNTLKCLSLSTNVFLTDLCVNDLVHMLTHNQALTNLYLNNGNITERGKIRLREIANRKRKFRIEL